MMMNSSVARHSFGRSLRLLGGTALAVLMLSAAASQRAEALSPINPGISGAKSLDNGLTIEVRGGHGGGGHGGGGGHSGGIGGVRAGSFSAGPAVSAASGVRVGHVAAGPGLAGHRFHHGFRHRHGFFVGGISYDDYPYDYGYPYDDYPAVVAVPGCRIVQTGYGPRQVCHRLAHHHHHRHNGHHHHHRHHQA